MTSCCWVLQPTLPQPGSGKGFNGCFDEIQFSSLYVDRATQQQTAWCAAGMHPKQHSKTSDMIDQNTQAKTHYKECLQQLCAQTVEEVLFQLPAGWSNATPSTLSTAHIKIKLPCMPHYYKPMADSTAVEPPMTQEHVTLQKHCVRKCWPVVLRCVTWMLQCVQSKWWSGV